MKELRPIDPEMAVVWTHDRNLAMDLKKEKMPPFMYSVDSEDCFVNPRTRKQVFLFLKKKKHSRKFIKELWQTKDLLLQEVTEKGTKFWICSFSKRDKTTFIFKEEDAQKVLIIPS